MHLDHIPSPCPQWLRDCIWLGQILGSAFSCWETLELSHIPGFFYIFHSRSLSIWLFALQTISLPLPHFCASHLCRVPPLGYTQKVTRLLLRTATQSFTYPLCKQTPKCVKLWVLWKTPQGNREHKLADDWEEHEGLLTPMHILVIQDQRFCGTHSRLSLLVSLQCRKITIYVAMHLMILGGCSVYCLHTVFSTYLNVSYIQKN